MQAHQGNRFTASHCVHSNRLVIAVCIALALTACGSGGGGGSNDGDGVGGGGGAPAVLAGQFKDSNTQGLEYASGGLSGTTAADGGFSCERGEMVSFAVGRVDIGSAPCQAIVTPLDLIASSSTSDVRVTNIARFLQLLDDNQDPSDGIVIENNLQLFASAWPQVDFTVPDVETELTATILPDVRAVLGNPGINVPTVVAAQAHLESTIHQPCFLNLEFPKK